MSNKNGIERVPKKNFNRNVHKMTKGVLIRADLDLAKKKICRNGRSFLREISSPQVQEI